MTVFDHFRVNLCLLGCLVFPMDPATSFQECKHANQADIIILLDGSGSVGNNDFSKALNFVNVLVDAFVIGPTATQFALVVFTASIESQFNLNEYTTATQLKSAIASTPYPARGGQDIAEAIRYAMNMFQNSSAGCRQTATGITVLMTDGQSIDAEQSIEAAHTLKNHSVTIYTVGVGSGVNVKELKTIASNTSYYFNVGDFNALESISGSIQSSTCSDLGGCICYNGGSCTPGNLGNKCICPQMYKGFYCEIHVCTQQTDGDIVLVMDGSLSEGNKTFSKQKEYVKDFISKYRVGPPNNRYQFSLITYSLNPTVQFYLNTYDNDTELQNAVDMVTYCGGPSFTGKALRKVRQDIFTQRNGARNNTVERYVVLLTDGLSSDPVDTIREANALKANGVKIYTVGSGHSVRHAELLTISSFRSYVFPMATNDSLHNILKYTVLGCDDCTTNFSDVAVIMDVSANIGAKQFDTQINAAIHLLRISAIGHNATKFSYSTFADTIHNIFSLDKFSDHADLISEVNSKTQKVNSLNANISNALDDLYENGFSASVGSRTEARQIVVLITAGKGFDIEEAIAAAKRLKDSGRIIVTIGSGLSANMTNLLELSSDPAFTYILGDDVYIDVDVLDSLWTTLVYDYCSDV